MDPFKSFLQKRKTKQLVMALVFVTVLVLGWQYPLLGYFIPLCMLVGLGVGLRHGRRWCDWCCPRGSFYDAIMSAASPRKEIPGFLRKIQFRIGVLVFLMAVMTLNLIKRWPSLSRIGMLFVILLTVTTLLGVILALLIHPRTWCSVCPVGTAVYLMGRKKRSVEINSEDCVECKLCAKVCPVQIKPYTYKAQGRQLIWHGDCLGCRLCIVVCPKRALHFRKF